MSLKKITIGGIEKHSTQAATELLPKVISIGHALSMSQGGVPVWDISDPFPGQHHQGTENDENGYRPRKLIIVHRIRVCQYRHKRLRQNPIRTIIVTTLATWRVDQKTPLMGLDGSMTRLPTRKITSQASQIVQNTNMIRASRRGLLMTASHYRRGPH